MAAHVFDFQEVFHNEDDSLDAQYSYLIISSDMKISKFLPNDGGDHIDELEQSFPGMVFHETPLTLRNGKLDTGNLEESNHLLHHFLGTKFILKGEDCG